MFLLEEGLVIKISLPIQLIWSLRTILFQGQNNSIQTMTAADWKLNFHFLQQAWGCQAHPSVAWFSYKIERTGGLKPRSDRADYSSSRGQKCFLALLLYVSESEERYVYSQLSAPGPSACVSVTCNLPSCTHKSSATSTSPGQSDWIPQHASRPVVPFNSPSTSQYLFQIQDENITSEVCH